MTYKSRLIDTVTVPVQGTGERRPTEEVHLSQPGAGQTVTGQSRDSGGGYPVVHSSKMCVRNWIEVRKRSGMGFDEAHSRRWRHFEQRL